MRFGVLLPHFGEHAEPERLLGWAPVIEEMGYDSVWVRDHLVYTPHGMESDDRTFYEPLLTLAAVGAVTTDLGLGTAVLIPIRWPIKLAQNLATLSHISSGRITAGLGLGNAQFTFDNSGLDWERKDEVLAETVQIVRRLWSEDHVTHHGELFSFDDVSMLPKPARPIPLVYGGTTRAAVRRAVGLMDGWIPGRIPLATLDDRLAYLRGLAAERGKEMLLGTIPLVVAHRDRAKARDDIDPEALGVSSHGAKYWVPPASGSFSTVDDLEGLLIAGDRDDCIREIAKLEQRGLDLVVLDLRLHFERFMEQLELLAEWVLPEFSG
ncbi:MAG TPA: TIGR03619 family F420-dependent LLM class oxidoreductase [Acidimicrobiia bacterium]